MTISSLVVIPEHQRYILVSESGFLGFSLRGLDLAAEELVLQREDVLGADLAVLGVLLRGFELHVLGLERGVGLFVEEENFIPVGLDSLNPVERGGSQAPYHLQRFEEASREISEEVLHPARVFAERAREGVERVGGFGLERVGEVLVFRAQSIEALDPELAERFEKLRGGLLPKDLDERGVGSGFVAVFEVGAGDFLERLIEAQSDEIARGEVEDGEILLHALAPGSELRERVLGALPDFLRLLDRATGFERELVEELDRFRGDMTTSSTPKLVVFTAETGRRYLDSSDIAAICGVSAFALDRTYRPEHWAHPRDMRWDGRRLWYAEESLQQLVDNLFAAGASDAAIRLREWLPEAIAQRARTIEHAAPPQARNAEPTPRNEPEGWSRKWEREHEL